MRTVQYPPSLVPRPRPKIGERAWSHLQKFPYVLCQQSSFGVEESHRPLPITTFLTREGSRLVPRPLKNGNKARRLFINLEFQKLIAYLCLLGCCSCLTGFPCGCSVARSAHLLCNAIVNSSWLPCDRKKHVIVT